MHGLPVGVQVVGQRLQEEKVLVVMERVEAAMDRWAGGGRYELLGID
jgi:Asp-tRNA(Asn)/Glu-tRNA(Gln) amidotransferase A subunit family amidase